MCQAMSYHNNTECVRQMYEPVRSSRQQPISAHMAPESLPLKCVYKPTTVQHAMSTNTVKSSSLIDNTLSPR